MSFGRKRSEANGYKSSQKGGSMKLGTRLSRVLASVLLTFLISPVSAEEFKTRLSGYQETPLTINSNGSGEFTAKIVEQKGVAIAIDYELTYRDLSSNVQQAHIHFGRPAISGQIILFLCTNLTPPTGVSTPQKCPLVGPATITGTLIAANVIARPTQGIDGGTAGLAQIIEAMRVDAAYVNVHTDNFTGGEIRGTLPGDGNDDR